MLRLATREPSLREFIGLTALIMALISLSIDNLLPCLLYTSDAADE